jgi:glucose/mannose transport system substrate-binding protein
MHQWTSAGEAAAVKELATQFNKAGGEWVDAATTGEENLTAAELARVVGGKPPTGMQFPMGQQMVDLASQGLLENLDAVAAEGKWAEVLPKAFLDAITHDGHIYAVPVNNHGQSWLWYSKAALAGVGASEPKTWEDLFAAAEKLKAAGIIPIAVGGQSWQLRITFNTVLVSKGGADLYVKVLGDRDAAAIRSPAFKEVVATFMKIRDYADPGNANRDWNVAANLVITGKAGFNFMGDWAKGEYTAAGQTAGKEFGCVLLGEKGDRNFIVSADTFVFPKNKDASVAATQKLLAKVIFDPETQILFNAKKGSVPARVDVDASKVDACSAIGLAALADQKQQAPSIEFLGTADFVGQVGDLVGQLWADNSMTADQFVDKFATVAKDIK